MDNTLDYYEKNARSFAESTQDVEFSDLQDRFLAFLPKGTYILDFGCGAGRDAKYFLKKGFRVDATDGSESLCQIASANTGLEVKHMLFSELDADSAYDGIWACASILHLPKSELADVLPKMQKALKPGGYIYTSFKYGEFEGSRNGRYFTDFTEKTFGEFLAKIPGLKLTEEWISSDARPGREDEKWLNLIITK